MMKCSNLLNTRNKLWIAIVGLAAIFAHTQSTYAQVTFGGDATGLMTYDFEDLAEYSEAFGTAFAIVRNDELGITFGEKLVGQIVQADGVFDVISGTPQTPLRMDDSIDPIYGVNIIHIFSSTMIDGIGNLGYPHRDALAEGAITVLYDIDQQVIGFDLLATNDGIVYIQMFNRKGQRIAEYTIESLKDDTFVFTSSQANIAAITLSTTDKAGLVYDNFKFVPAPSNRETFCFTNGPYVEIRQGEVTAVQLNALSADDPDGDMFAYHWITECSDATFDDKYSPTPTMVIDTPDTCEKTCTVTLLVDNGIEIDVCTTTVTVMGSAGSGSILSCPQDMIVESDGQGNVDDLNAWLNSVSSDDPNMTNDFNGITYQCGNTGSVSVTWTNHSSGCGDTSECMSTFTIVDSTPPVIDVDTTPIVVEDADCSGDEKVELPEAYGYDGDQELPVFNDAPETFPLGTTTVTYTATDDCGNTTTVTLSVTVLSNAGIDVQVNEHFVASRSRRGSWKEPIAGIKVSVYNSSRTGCAHDVNNGISSHSYADIVEQCTAVGSATTDEQGLAVLHLPTGQYIVIAIIDDDGDGAYDEYLGSTVGKVPCGQRKVVDLNKITHINR